MTRVSLPPELDRIKVLAQRAIFPIKPADENTSAEQDFFFKARRTKASRDLPRPHLVYFLLVDLLGFEDLGRFEKVAWSVPIDFEGTGYLVEHRKFGVGVFARDPDGEEANASRIVGLIKSGVAVAKPFFRWMANNAIRTSKLNVINNGPRLFDRYRYLLGLYKSESAQAEARREEVQVEQKETSSGTVTTYCWPYFELSRNAAWLAMAAIDAFFSWSEHIFIHLAILQGQVTTGAEVASLAADEWKVKFKRALDIKAGDTKMHFDKLVMIRRQLRNFMAHGAFGKEGEAFHFHSRVGAVPVALDYTENKQEFSLSSELAFDDAGAIEAIEKFIASLWSGALEPARIYIQESGLPLILPMAQDGTYKKAMSSADIMRRFVDRLEWEFTNFVNMDF